MVLALGLFIGVAPLPRAHAGPGRTNTNPYPGAANFGDRAGPAEPVRGVVTFTG